MAANDGTNGTPQPLPALAASAEEFLQHDYHYIIIGGGTAGLVLAARLSENPDVRVGVLEAGASRLNDPLVDIPAAYTQLLANPEYDWLLNTVPQENNSDIVHSVPRGKLLGGSSGINYMMYNRGSSSDFDDWAILSDDPSWSADNMKHYMRKSQFLEPINEKITDRLAMGFVKENHGTSGPIHTGFNDWRLSLETSFIDAADRAAGYPKHLVDAWSGDHLGFYHGMGAIFRTGSLRGKRSYAARGYFEQNAQRPNLKVLCEARATSVILEDNTAMGVNFLYNGTTHAVKPSREVLLSSGFVHSPQLLELSGIGDPEVLRAAGVECRIPLKSVGTNYIDHVLSAVSYTMAPGVKTLDQFKDPAILAEAQKQYSETQGGPLTSVLGGQGFISYRSTASDAELEAVLNSIRDSPNATPFQRKQFDLIARHLADVKSANIMLHTAPVSVNWDGIKDQSKLYSVEMDPNGSHECSIVAALQCALSRGTVHIRSADINDPPIIDPKYNSHPADRMLMAAGLRFADRVAQTEPFASLAANRQHPSPEYNLENLENCQEYVKKIMLGQYHGAGTCAMGETVDSRLRVKGVNRLRVVDASIFPSHTSGNPMSAVYALAEKAADMIKGEYDLAGIV